MAWPLADSRLETSSQLDACGFSSARRSWAPRFANFPRALALDALTAGATGASLTEPGSGMARPRRENALFDSYGKRFLTVTGASGSFLERKSPQALRPRLRP